MNGANRCVWVLALAAVLTASACRKKPPEPVPGAAVGGRVSMQSAASPSVNTDWARRVYSARFSTPVLPVYPPQAIEARIEQASVRVDFVIGVDGLAHEVTAEAQEPLPPPELVSAFEEACLEVAERWRFSPSWRLRREGEIGDDPVTLLDSRAYLVFRFDLSIHEQGGDVEVSFGDDP